jgi:hypothetical protein
MEMVCFGECGGQKLPLSDRPKKSENRPQQCSEKSELRLIDLGVKRSFLSFLSRVFLGNERTKNPHNVYGRQVRRTKWASTDWSGNLFEDWKIGALWRAHFSKNERVQGQLL